MNTTKSAPSRSPPVPSHSQSREKIFQYRTMKSLFAARSAMADAAHASLEYAREIRAGVDLSPSSSADKQALETATLAFRRGDDGKCVPNESFLICVEKTGGLPDSPIFLAARVVTSNGNLKGARAHTLSARRHDGAIDVAWSASTSRSSGHHVFCAKFDLRCVPAEGDVLSIETFVGSDTSQKSSSWGNAYARGVLSLQVLMSTTGTALRGSQIRRHTVLPLSW